MLKVEETTNTSCEVQAVLFNSDTLSKIIPYLQTETSRGKTTSDLFNLALTCTRLGISNNGVSLIEQSARIAVDDMIAIDSSLSHWCHEGENSLADYHRIRSAQDIQKESLEYLKWMVLIDHDENGRKLVRCNVTDDGQLTFKDINLGGDAVLFNSDALSKIISYLPAIDVLNLGLTCKRFGISNNDEPSLIEDSARIAVNNLATEEQLAALPHYEGESSLADYHYIQLMRAPLAFDQLVGRFEYVNNDKSCVKSIDWGTAFSNTILRAGKHYASFVIGGFGSVLVGVMRPGQANQNARGLPIDRIFFQHFSRNMFHDEHTSNDHCCMYSAANSDCWTSGWDDSRVSGSAWDGMERMSSGDILGLLLDLDEGTLSVYKNGKKLGVMKRGLAGPYCWVASMNDTGVTIKRGTIPPN